MCPLWHQKYDLVHKNLIYKLFSQRTLVVGSEGLAY